MKITKTKRGYQVKSESGKIYEVKFCGSGDGDPEYVGLWECTCPAYKYRDGICKHINAVIDYIDNELLKPQPPVTGRRNQMETNPKYPDATGYDCEGYGETTKIHKNIGCRRYYRPLYDSPITPEERAMDVIARQEEAAEQRKQASCWHKFQIISHEERECVKCGYVEFIADL